MTDNAVFRHMAGRLVDILKRPENAAILEQFLKYDARKKHGWGGFLGGGKLPSYLSPEQVQRWNALNDEAGINDSGHAVTLIWLVAQGMLGRADVYDNSEHTS